MGILKIKSSTKNRTCLPVTLEWPEGKQKTSALIDSGAEESFLETKTAASWGIPLVEVSCPLVANSLNDQKIRQITKATVPVRLLISGNHREEISLLIINTPHSPVILGHPWMVRHSLDVDWGKHEIQGWSTHCATRCLQEAHSPVTVPQEETVPNLAKVPAEYQDLK